MQHKYYKKLEDLVVLVVVLQTSEQQPQLFSNQNPGEATRSHNQVRKVVYKSNTQNDKFQPALVCTHSNCCCTPMS